LVRRVHQHKSHDVRGFSARYGVDRLVWFEVYDNPTDAIAREKALKNGGETGKSASSKNRIPIGEIFIQYCLNNFFCILK